MKASSNYFLVNMAVADLLVTVFNMPVELKAVFVGPTWLVSGSLGLVLCKCYTFCWFQAVNVSTGSLSAIAIDRFLLVFYPYKKIITRRAANIIIASIWMTAFFFTLPLLVAYRIKFENGARICYPEFDGNSVYLIVNFVAFVGTPLAIMSILYTALSVKLWLKKPVVNQMRISSVMLIMIVLTFALCWLPYWICTIYCYTTKSTPVCHGYQLNFVTKFLGFSNSAFNPCIYFSFSESFRQGAKELWKRFHCSLPCKQAEIFPASTNTESLPVRGTAALPN
ncbi:G-protein coupled receptor 83-like [Oculina patagonica]